VIKTIETVEKMMIVEELKKLKVNKPILKEPKKVKMQLLDQDLKKMVLVLTILVMLTKKHVMLKKTLQMLRPKLLIPLVKMRKLKLKLNLKLLLVL
jgi:hypothetical protein